MPYVKFSSNNYSIEYNTTLPDDSENWYEVPEIGNYKLVDGIVETCDPEEYKDSFTSGRIDTPFYVELKGYVSRFLADTDWIISRHLEQRENGETSITEEDYQSLILYRQYLRDLTNNSPEQNQDFVFSEFPLKNRYSYPSYDDLRSLILNK